MVSYLQMKTKLIFQRCAGLLIGFPLSIFIILIPTIIYVYSWYAIPKTGVPVFLLFTLAGPVWIVVQFGLVFAVLRWWYQHLSR